jgi:hypothetical protein
MGGWSCLEFTLRRPERVSILQNPVQKRMVMGELALPGIVLGVSL